MGGAKLHALERPGGYREKQIIVYHNVSGQVIEATGLKGELGKYRERYNGGIEVLLGLRGIGASGFKEELTRVESWEGLIIMLTFLDSNNFIA